MPNVSYDTLSIKIEADSKQANASIKNLSTNLRNLDEEVKKLDTKRLIEVRGLLQSIAKIDFSNVAKGLHDVVSAFKAFNTKAMSKAFDKVESANIQTDYPTPEQNFELVGDSYTNGFETIKQELVAVNQQLDIYQEHIKDAFGDGSPVGDSVNIFEQLRQALENAGYSGEQIDAVFRSIKTESSVFNTDQIERLKEIMASLGISAEEADRVIKHLKTDTDNLDKGAKKGANGLQKLLNQFGKIMRYRIIRKIIQEIYKALSEGINNVISFDEATSKSINELKSKFEFVKNSLGSMFAPLIQMITPILTAIMQLVGDVNNQFAEIFAGANGQTTFAKASDDLKDFNDQAKKTKALGIDELNVFQQDSTDGMFTQEEVKLGEDTEGIAGAIKKLFAEIKNIIDKIKPVIQDLVSKLLPAISNLLTPIVEIIGTILDLVLTLVGQTFSDVNSSVAEFINMLGSVLGFVSKIVNLVANVLKPVIHIISAVINIINSALGGIFKVIGDIFETLDPILNIVNVLLVPVSALLTCVSTIFYVIEGIVKTIIKIVTLDWANIGTVWADVGDKIKQAWQDMGDIANKSVQGFASGGFPEDGLFFANHNELVGQFSNGQTAVANNQQITEGIYQAVLQAMRESGGANGNISIQIDGYELAKIITKEQKNLGADLIVGGNLAYGK